MSSTLYGYYERELLFIREEAQQFAQQYPAAAGRLLLEPNGSIDPHVERLIEAFALLTGRVQKKLDDDFSELTDGLLSVLYPHYLAPIPSLAIVEFQPETANAKPEGIVIEHGTGLHTQRIEGCECRFRTCYPTTLWPLKIDQAQFQSLPLGDGLQPPPGAVAALRIQLSAQGQLSFSDLKLDALRIFLSGVDEVVASLYGLIFNNTVRVQLRTTDQNTAAQAVTLPPDSALRPVGFGRDEGLLPYQRQSFLGYRLLTEFFSFPCKFHFVDIAGWQQAASRGFGRSVEIVLFLDHAPEGLEQEIDADNFRIGCCPVVNLFHKTAEPIKFTQNRTSYLVRPDVHRPFETEVYSVDSVTSADPRSMTRYRPFYGVRHASPWNDEPVEEAYWYAQRRESMQDGDGGTDVYLHLVDRDFTPLQPADSVIITKTTCTNRELPLRLQQAGNAIRFQLETSAPVKAIHCVRAPTAPRRPPVGRQAYWNLMSHLTLNHLSLEDSQEGCAALQDMLRLYEFSRPGARTHNTTVNQRLVDGIVSVSSRHVVGRVDATVPAGFCRGIEVTMELDPQKFVGTGSFLFAAVIERFLGMFCSLNSFSQLVVKLKGSDEIMRKWPPRAGEMRLL